MDTINTLSGIILREHTTGKVSVNFDDEPSRTYDAESSFFVYIQKDIIGIPAGVDVIEGW